MGAVVVFKKHGSMTHGHVAVVAHLVNSRKLMVDHANWAPHRSHRRGLVSKMVMVTDVSPRNDWSMVRVWDEMSGELGQRIYPTYGFIYPRAGQLQVALKDEPSDEAETANFEEPVVLDQASAVSALASLNDFLAPPVQGTSFALDSSVSQ